MIELFFSGFVYISAGNLELLMYLNWYINYHIHLKNKYFHVTQTFYDECISKLISVYDNIP